MLGNVKVRPLASSSRTVQCGWWVWVVAWPGQLVPPSLARAGSSLSYVITPAWSNDHLICKYIIITPCLIIIIIIISSFSFITIPVPMVIVSPWSPVVAGVWLLEIHQNCCWEIYSCNDTSVVRLDELDDLEVLEVKSGDKNCVQFLASVGIKHNQNPTYSHQQFDSQSELG